MNALTIEALPQGLELSPAERAWDTYDYLTKHPERWNQEWYGNRMIDGHLYGCFAFHTVVRAGFTPTNPHDAHPNSFAYVSLAEATEQIDWRKVLGAVANFSGYQVEGHVMIPALAQHLLGHNVGGECSTCNEPRLFCPGNDLLALRVQITRLFGPAPVTA